MMNQTQGILQVWDLAGENQFRLFMPSYCQGAHGGIFVYNITSTPSLSHLRDWFSVVQIHTSDLPVFVVGAKKDLEIARKVTMDEAKAQVTGFGSLIILKYLPKLGKTRIL